MTGASATARAVVLRALRETGGAPVRGLERRLRMSATTIRRSLRSLELEGLASRETLRPAGAVGRYQVWRAA